MITRFESTPEHLIVESRRTADGRAVIAASVGLTAVVLLGVLEFAGLDWAVTRRFVLPSPTTLAVLVLIAGVGIPLIAVPWLFYGRERIMVRDRELTHERFIGPRRTFHARYDLLKMHGLRELSVPDSDVSATGLWFFYGRTGVRLGDTLAPDERERVRDELLAYDARVRVALGIDPGLGLADVSAWESPEVRRAIFEEQAFNRRHMTFPDRGRNEW